MSSNNISTQTSDPTTHQNEQDRHQSPPKRRRKRAMESSPTERAVTEKSNTVMDNNRDIFGRCGNMNNRNNIELNMDSEDEADENDKEGDYELDLSEEKVEEYAIIWYTHMIRDCKCFQCDQVNAMLELKILNWDELTKKVKQLQGNGAFNRSGNKKTKKSHHQQSRRIHYRRRRNRNRGDYDEDSDESTSSSSYYSSSSSDEGTRQSKGRRRSRSRSRSRHRNKRHRRRKREERRRNKHESRKGDNGGKYGLKGKLMCKDWDVLTSVYCIHHILIFLYVKMLHFCYSERKWIEDNESRLDAMVGCGFSKPLNEMIKLCMSRPDFKDTEMTVIQNGLTNFTASEMVLPLEHNNFDLLYWHKAEQCLKKGVDGAEVLMNTAQRYQHTMTPNPRPSKQTSDESNCISNENQTQTPNLKTQTGDADKLMRWSIMHHEAQQKQASTTTAKSSKSKENDNGGQFDVKLKHVIKYALLKKLGKVKSVRDMLENGYMDKKGFSTEDITKYRLKVFPKMVGGTLSVPSTYYKLSQEEYPCVTELYDKPIQKYLDACYKASDVENLKILKWDDIKKKSKDDKTLYGKLKKKRGKSKKKNGFIDLESKEFKNMNLNIAWPRMMEGIYQEGYNKS